MSEVSGHLKKELKRYIAKAPELGGRIKDCAAMNRMELRENVIATRRKCAEAQNAALVKYGIAAARRFVSAEAANVANYSDVSSVSEQVVHA